MTSLLRQTVVIDVGGTKIRAGCLEDSDAPRHVVFTPLARLDIESALIAAVTTVATRLEAPLRGIVVGCPGLIDRTGKVSAAIYLETAGLHVSDLLSRTFNVPVRTVNDAHLQALALTSNVAHGAYIVLGTGIGGAIISNSLVLTGTNGYAGEIGHIPASGVASKCLCGRTGCLDTVASGYWLERTLGRSWWQRIPLPADAIATLAQAGRHVGLSASILNTLLDLDTITLAGHLTRHGAFVAGVKAGLKEGDASVALDLHADTWHLVVDGARKIATTQGGLLCKS